MGVGAGAVEGRGYMGLSAAISSRLLDVQGSAKRRAPGSVNFAPAVTYHVCLGLPFTHPGAHLFAEPCTLSDDEKEGKAVNQCEYFCFCCFTSLHRIHFNQASAEHRHA